MTDVLAEQLEAEESMFVQSTHASTGVLTGWPKALSMNEAAGRVVTAENRRRNNGR